MASNLEPLEEDPEMVELLDSLLGGDSGGADSDSWGAAPPLQWDDDAPEEPPPALPADWRCINPAHAAPCARCQPAPSEAEEACFAIVGETPGQNGVKALRAQVVATPEWRDASTRLRLAASWAQAGGARAALAPAVRACAASALRRGHLLALCRAFRFASTLWRRKPQQAPSRARATALALAPVAQPLPPASVPAFTLWLSNLGYEAGVQPFRESSALFAAVAAQDARHLRAAHAAQFALLSRLCLDGAAALRMQAAAARRWHAACASRHAPAWTVLPPGGLLVESFIRVGDRIFFEAVTQPPPDASPATRAAAEELHAAVLQGGDIDVRVLGALEQLKAAPLPDFLLALSAAATFWADWTEEWGTEAAQRAAWARQLIRDESVPPEQPSDALVLSGEQPAPGQLLCATAAQGEAIESLIRDVERQCATLRLVP